MKQTKKDRENQKEYLKRLKENPQETRQGMIKALNQVAQEQHNEEYLFGKGNKL